MSVRSHQVLRILEVLATEVNGLRLSELALSIAANPGSVLRLLRDLQDAGYVSQDPVSDRWYATLRLAALGLSQFSVLRDEAKGYPRLHELARATRELAMLAMSVEDRLMWVEAAQGSEARLTVVPRIGSEVLLHATASGKVFLSAHSDEQVIAMLKARGMDAFTSATITDTDKLLAEVSEVRRLGYAVVIGEMETGINAVAAPIRSVGDPQGPAVGSVSVAGPATRLDQQALEALVPHLLEASHAIATEWRGYCMVFQPSVVTGGNGRGVGAGVVSARN